MSKLAHHNKQAKEIDRYVYFYSTTHTKFLPYGNILSNTVFEKETKFYHLAIFLIEPRGFRGIMKTSENWYLFFI